MDAYSDFRLNEH